jgi:hypothetical protein
MLMLFISLTAAVVLPHLNIQSEAQPSAASASSSSSLYQDEKLLDSNNIAFFLLDAFEYTFDIDAAQIFPNDTIKHSIVTEYIPSVYRIPSLQYKILDHMINASDVQIHVNPTRIDDQNTRLDFQIYANKAQVSGQLLYKTYDNLEITSAYAIYNRATDKMTIHVPYSVALQHLTQ